MNILILHRIPYHKIDYHRGIDHDAHHVVYLGTEAALSNIPAALRCEKWQRPGVDKTDVEAINVITERGASFDIVLSLSEYELMSAAIVREHFGIQGANIAQIERVRNKLLMKQIVDAAGIAVPHNLCLSDFAMTDQVKWSGKTVLKPVDGASSENVLVFDSIAQLRDALAKRNVGIALVDGGDYQGYEVEQFVSGDILHFDGLMLNGELKLVVTSKYVGNCLDFAKGQPLGSVQIDTSDELRDWSLAVLRAIELNTGSFHLEAILSDNGLVFLEIANRVGGAEVVASVELATGVHLPSAELKAYLGDAVDVVADAQSAKKFGWFVFPGHHLGQPYCVVKNSDRFKQHELVVRWNELAVDQPLTKHITYQSVEVPVAGIVSSACSTQLANFMRDVFATIEVH
ncbi:ATP-grasp domain-containing protein [Jeongeupia wiesaeckerbachi]|uniref:ATP-grasp domain-containing protein n=1 Tax=Jeongeupia wiesaeckerbachi TaxID=3051218 RepID=UPI003D802BF2